MVTARCSRLGSPGDRHEMMERIRIAVLSKRTTKTLSDHKYVIS
jgi:hypothetical protein